MGLLDRMGDAAVIGDGVAGQAKVLNKELTRAGAQQTEALNRSWRLRLSVATPDAEAYEVEHTCTIPWDKMPRTGQTLPVTVSRSDPRRLRIDWDRATSLTEAATRAQELVDAGDFEGAAAAMGFNLSGSAGLGRFAPARARQAAERIALIAKLQGLREAGALTDEEFEAEKSRLLSEE